MPRRRAPTGNQVVIHIARGRTTRHRGLLLLGVAACGLTWLSANWSELLRQDLRNVPGDPTQLFGTVIALTSIGGPLLKLAQMFRMFGVDPGKLVAESTANSSARDQGAGNELRARFATEFNEVTGALGPGHRLIVFIDDLDRCTKEHLLQVLEITNLLNSSGECFVVLGIDRDAVMRGLKQALPEHHERTEPGVTRWLEKLIQIEVALPKPENMAVGITRTVHTPTPRHVRIEKAIRRSAAGVAVVTMIVVGAWLGSGDLIRPKPSPGKSEPAVEPVVLEGTLGENTPIKLTVKLPAGLIPAATANPGETGALARGEVKPPPASDRSVSIAKPVIVVAAALLSLAYRRATRERPGDSREFLNALVDWEDTLQDHCDTPREVKRLINRMRFDAMFLRGITEPDDPEQSAEAVDCLRQNEAHVVTLVMLQKLHRRIPTTAEIDRLFAVLPLPEQLRERISSAVAAWRQPEGPFAQLREYQLNLRAFTQPPGLGPDMPRKPAEIVNLPAN